jgi:hypothetical protein
VALPEWAGVPKINSLVSGLLCGVIGRPAALQIIEANEDGQHEKRAADW